MLKVTATDSQIPFGGVAFGGTGSGMLGFDNVIIGYDNNGDGDIDDAGDEIVRSETFGGTTCTVKHDDAGNLIDDCEFVYIYDAWNRLVKVRASNDSDVTIQTAEFDATGRRMSKTVTNAGDLDAKTRYYYDGQKIIETRVGTEIVMNQQFIHGTQYIDELVMVRVAKKGDLYVHQDANWNVIGLTDLAGSIVEAYTLSPYGELTVDQETGYGDRDADGDVDATDKGTPGTDCTGTVTGACRVLDLDFDGDYDATDAGNFDSLPQGNMIHPGRVATNVDQPFGHQGLLFEPEIGSYQNRARQYDPAERRFAQRDPLGYVDGLNHYRYVASNPVTRADPTGRQLNTCCPCGKAAMAIGLIGAVDATTCKTTGDAASSDAAGAFPGPNTDNQQDAFRHCLWQCRLRLEIGTQQAGICGDINEACGKNTPGAEAMDQYNNSLGRDYYGYGATNGSCYDGCYGAVVRAGSGNTNPNPGDAQTAPGGTPPCNATAPGCSQPGCAPWASSAPVSGACVQVAGV